MGDGEGTVSGTFRDDTLGPEVHCEVRPVVVFFDQFLPAARDIFPPFRVANEPLKRGEVDDHAVVEVRVPERGGSCDFGAEFAKFFDEFPLCGQRFSLGRRLRSARLPLAS